LADVTIDSIDVHTTRSVYYLRVVNPETIKKLQEFVS
jgi:hypothetical protein